MSFSEYTLIGIYIYIYIERSKVEQHNVDQNDKISSVKVIDFGFSVLRRNRHKEENFTGTAQFLNPKAKTK